MGRALISPPKRWRASNWPWKQPKASSYFTCAPSCRRSALRYGARATHAVCRWAHTGSTHPRPQNRTQTRKDVAAVFSGLLRTTVDGRQPCLQYLQEHQDLLITLTKACVLFRVPTVAPVWASRGRDTHVWGLCCRYDKTDTALITGSMLREAIKWPAFAKCDSF